MSEPFFCSYRPGFSAPIDQDICTQCALSWKIAVSEWLSLTAVSLNFIIWPSCVTLTINLLEQMFQMALLLLKKSYCAKLFWNPCTHVNYDPEKLNLCHFIGWPSFVTLTFNLPKQMFKMALLLLKENACAKLFWNPCINVSYGLDILFGCFGLNSPLKQHFSLIGPSPKEREKEEREMIDERKNVQTTPTCTYCKCSRPMPYYYPNQQDAPGTGSLPSSITPPDHPPTTQTSSIYDHFIIWPSSVTLIFNLPNK